MGSNGYVGVSWGAMDIYTRNGQLSGTGYDSRFVGWLRSHISTPQHGTLSTRLDEISGSLGVPRKLYFGPDPLSDPQIDPLRPHLEKISACGAQRVPAALPLRGGRCLPAPCLKCGFQYSTRNTSALMGGAIFFKACGAGKGTWGRGGKGLQ